VVGAIVLTFVGAIVLTLVGAIPRTVGAMCGADLYDPRVTVVRSVRL
jgi:hypothetical protein